MVTIRSITWHTCAVPLVRPVVLPAGTVTVRNPLFVRVTDEEGVTGWGEASPLEGFTGWVRHEELIREAGEVARRLSGDDYIPSRVESCLPSIAFAISSAVAWIERQRSPARSEMVLPLVSLVRDAHDRQALSGGCVKVKVGGDVQEDVAFFKDIVSGLPEVKVRLDANRRWSFEQAVSFLEAVDIDRIDFFEEPCDALTRFSELADAFGVAVAVDESLQEASYKLGIEGVEEVLDLAGVAVIKPTMIGSIEKCRTIASRAVDSGCRVVLSSAYESGIGMLGILDLARQLGPRQEPAGLGTYSAISFDILRPPLRLDRSIALDAVLANVEVDDEQFKLVE